MILQKETALWQKDKLSDELESLQSEIDNTASYFWYVDGTGSEAGAHVTRIPKDDFLVNPRGGNLFLKADAVSLRNGIYTLATFRDVGMVLGDSAINVMYGVNGFGYYKYNGTASNMFDYTADNTKVSTKLTVADAQNSNYIELKQVNGVGTLVTDAPIESSDNITTTGNGSFGSLDISGRAPFTTFTATGKVSINAGTGGNVSVTGTVPTGYTPIAVQGISTDHNYTCLIGKFLLTSNGADISLRNVSSTNYTNMAVNATILCTSLQ